MATAPYINFGGNCREAFTFYHQIFGGELDIRGFDELPDGADPTPALESQVMHAVLKWGDDNILLGSDNPYDFAGVNGMMVNYTVDSVTEARRAYDALAEGGDVLMEFTETFWSPGFGMVSDRFGNPWMFNTVPN